VTGARRCGRLFAILVQANCRARELPRWPTGKQSKSLTAIGPDHRVLDVQSFFAP
jgi:hypothetical protein